MQYRVKPHAPRSLPRYIVLSSELRDARNMNFVFLRSIRPSSCPILSRRISLLAVLCILLFCETAKSSIYPFEFPLGTIFPGNQTVLSQNGTFEAGLFSPPGSDFVYLGIWFAGISVQTAVWVANRNQPVSGTASYGCSTNGELQLLDSIGSVIWSSETNGRNVSGGAFDSTGNIMLLGESASDVVWQTFDYPGNTLLPMMKMRPEKKLISWKSASDPSEGPYSLGMLHTGEFVAMWKNEKQYFTTGAWNGRGFSNLPETAYHNRFISSFFDDSGFWWTLSSGFHFLGREVLETNGLIYSYSWDSNFSAWNPFWFTPKDPCVVYGLCGPYGVCDDNVSPLCSCPTGFEPADAEEWASNVWSGGCSLKATLDCREGVSDDGFVQLQNTSFDVQWRQKMAELGPIECMEACLRNCSCAAYSYDGSGENCELLGGRLLNGRTSPDVKGTVHMRVAAEDVEAGSGGRTGRGRWEIRKWMAEFCVVAASLLVLGSAASAAFGLKRRQRTAKVAGLSGVSASIECFTYAQLQAGTRNFSERLGSGGFGEVFKGSLPGGAADSAIAVKQLLAESQRHGEKQFRMEVATIGSIQHINLVRLRGFCTEKSHRLLVYDYMTNGSLDSYLSSVKTPPTARNSSNARPLLDWATRYRIALGTARGIAYLHDGCRRCIIHCDIKPGNILLDADFSAKVADFGLAKFMGREFSRVLTSFRGTRGYLAPEWIAGMPITTKADVYSFGMTMLELVSGRRNTDHALEPSPASLSSSGSNSDTVVSTPTPKVADPHQRFFPVWAAFCLQEGRDLIMGLVDTRLCGLVDHEQLRRVVFTAVWCIQDQETSRPTMRHVVQILEGSVDVSLPPMPESLRLLVLEEDPWPTTHGPSAPSPLSRLSWLNQPWKSTS